MERLATAELVAGRGYAVRLHKGLAVRIILILLIVAVVVIPLY